MTVDWDWLKMERRVPPWPLSIRLGLYVILQAAGYGP